MNYNFRQFDPESDIPSYIQLYRDVLQIDCSWEYLAWKNRDVRVPDRTPLIYLAIGKKGDLASSAPSPTEFEISEHSG